MASVKTTQHNLEITDVSSIVITPVTQDPLAGDWVRDIRIMGAEGTGEAMVVQLRLRSPTKDPIEIEAPAQEF